MTAFADSTLARGDLSGASSALLSMSGWQIVVATVLCVVVTFTYGELSFRQRTRNSVSRHFLTLVARDRAEFVRLLGPWKTAANGVVPLS